MLTLFSAAALDDLSHAQIAGPVPLSHWLVIAPVVWCITFGALTLILRGYERLQTRVALAALIGLVLLNALLLRFVVGEGTVSLTMGRWLPPFGISFTVDLMGALFSLTAAIVALAGGIYGLSDIDRLKRRYGFYPLLLLLMAGVSGAFLTGDIFNLYVWFEVLLISSFGLLVLGSEHRQLDGTLKYAVLNLLATTLFLIATGYLYALFGTLNMADLFLKAEAARDTAPLLLLVVLFLLAFLMKAAAFPVNAWLPASYHTPSIVVSALFSALLTKVGIYALLRVGTMLFGPEVESLSLLLAIIAIATMITGALGTLAQSDLRRAFAFVVISGIGTMLAGIAIDTPPALSGTLFYALHSMLLMAALFMLAGLAARLSGGSFSLHHLKGLQQGHPLLAAIALILIFAASGLPPFSGFWPKVMLAKAAIDIGAWWLAAAILLTGFLTLIGLGRIYVLVWWRPADGQATTAVPLPMAALLPLIALATLIVIIGLFPDTVIDLVQQAAITLVDPSSYVHAVLPEAMP